MGNLTTGSFGDRETAVGALATSGDARAAAILEALAAGQLYVRKSDNLVLIGKPDGNQLALDRGDLRQAGRQRHPKPTSTASGSTTGCAASSRRPSARSP